MATVKQVYTGILSAYDGSEFSATLPSSVDMSKSILFFESINAPTTTATSNTSFLMCGQLIDSNTLAFKSNATTSADVYWKVVEFTNGVTVQRNTFSTMSAANINHTINTVDINKTFTILTMYPFGSTTTVDKDDLIYPQITTTTNLSISSLGTPSSQVYSYQVVSYDKCNVTTVTATLPNSQTFTSASTGLTLTSNKNMLIGHYASTDTALHGREAPVYYLSGNDIYIQTISATTNDFYCSIQVIQFTDNTRVQSYIVNFGNETNITTTLTANVDVNKTIPFLHKVFHSYGANTVSFNSNRNIHCSYMVSSSQFAIRRGVGSVTSINPIDIVQFGVDTGYLDRSYMRGLLRGLFVGT